MYAGIAVYDLKPGKKTEASRIWNEAFVPVASKQAGFKGALWLTAPDNDKAIGIELWEMDLAASAFETNGLFQRLLEKFQPVLARTPIREEYSALQLLV
jgi:hypothetical protein